MPVYSYHCESCGARFERFLHIQDYDKDQQCDCKSIAIKTYSSYNTGGNTVLSAKEKEALSIPFGKDSARKFNTVSDVKAHIQKKNREYGMKIDVVGNNY